MREAHRTAAQGLCSGLSEKRHIVYIHIVSIYNIYVYRLRRAGVSAPTEGQWRRRHSGMFDEATGEIRLSAGICQPG